MTALAVRDEHSPLGDLQIVETQPKHLGTAQRPEHHRFDHRPITPPATRLQQRIDLGRLQDRRQRPWRAHQRCSSVRARPFPVRQPSRHRVRIHLPACQQEAEQPRDRRQPALDRASRQPRLAIDQPDHTTIAALVGDEAQHVARRDLARFLRNNGEEHLEVVTGRQRRVRPSTRRHKIEIAIHLLLTEPQTRSTSAIGLANQHRNPRHRTTSTIERTAQPSASRNPRWITGIWGIRR